jgi:hypothetical protein
MPELTRRRNRECQHECWHVYYGDVRVGTIGIRPGVPIDVDQWGWNCGFYPGVEPREHRDGTAPTFEEARADFEVACRSFLAVRTDADFEEYRRHRAYTAWKYAMWDAGCRLPTQLSGGRSRCFCGSSIDISGTEQHIYAAHMSAPEDAAAQ